MCLHRMWTPMRLKSGPSEYSFCVAPSVVVLRLLVHTARGSKALVATAVSVSSQREFYDGVVLDCYSAGVCVDVHAYPSSRRDKIMLQTLESIATHTGGKVFYQHDFLWQR